MGGFLFRLRGIRDIGSGFVGGGLKAYFTKDSLELG
jgi:hypothetical protein